MDRMRRETSALITTYHQKFSGMKNNNKSKEEAKIESSQEPENNEGKIPLKEQRRPKPMPYYHLKPNTDPELVEILNECKIRRFNKGKEILPLPDKKNILVTGSLLHRNHMPMVYNMVDDVLSADVFARFARLRGYNILFICGTEEEQKQGSDLFFNKQKEIYEWLDCDFDCFGSTKTEKHVEIVQDMFLKLYNNELIQENSVSQPYCETCKRFLALRFLCGTCPYCHYPEMLADICDQCGRVVEHLEECELKCRLCGSKPNYKDIKNLLLKLPRLALELEEWKQKSSSEGRWTNNAKQITKIYIEQHLAAKCITRNLILGIGVPLEEFRDSVFFSWFEAPIGYLSVTANYTQNWEKWWKDPDNVKLVQFTNKENIIAHTVTLPSIMIGTGEDFTMINSISAAENVKYADRFTAGKAKRLYVENLRDSGIPPEIFRYYFLANRPENSDTEFSWEDLADKANHELLPNLGNLCNRTFKFIYEKFDKRVPDFNETDLNHRDKGLMEEIYSKFEDYLAAFEKIEIKNALKLAMEMSAICNKYMQEEKPWEQDNLVTKRSNVVMGVLVSVLRLVLGVFEPFMPSFSAKAYYILNKTDRTQEDETFFEVLVNGGVEAVMKLIPKGQLLNKPVPLIQAVTPKDISEYID